MLVPFPLGMMNPSLEFSSIGVCSLFPPMVALEEVLLVSGIGGFLMAQRVLALTNGTTTLLDRISNTKISP